MQTISIKHRRSPSKSSDDDVSSNAGSVGAAAPWARPHHQRAPPVGRYRRELSHGPPVTRTSSSSSQPSRRNSFTCSPSWHQDGPIHCDGEQPVYVNLNTGRWKNHNKIRSGHKQQRSERKLTKDSGYETSPATESEYVNSDWVSRAKTEMISPDGNEVTDRFVT